jgi:hypothetical protein
LILFSFSHFSFLKVQIHFNQHTFAMSWGIIVETTNVIYYDATLTLALLTYSLTCSFSCIKYDYLPAMHNQLQSLHEPGWKMLNRIFHYIILPLDYIQRCIQILFQSMSQHSLNASECKIKIECFSMVFHFFIHSFVRSRNT